MKSLSIVLLLLVLVACAPASPEIIEASDTPRPAALPSPTTAPTAVPGVLYVDPQTSLGPISPYVYGTNYGPFVAVPLEMIPAAEQSGVKAIRFPGGEWGDRNTLKSYQIDQFIAFSRQLGAEPTISVRLLGGTPEAAAELVRSSNLEKGYQVKYWSIGNEPNLYEAYIGKPYDTVRFNQEWRAIAEAMKAVDPSILLLGPEITGTTSNQASNPKDSAGRDWMVQFLKANGDLVDVVAYHRYPFPLDKFTRTTVEDMRRNTAEWDETIISLRALIREHTGRDLPIAITEVNSHYTKAIQGETTPDSHYNAVWWADVLGRLIRQNVFMVNHWLLTSTGAQGGWGIITGGEVRPSYYVYSLYQRFGEQQVYASSDDPYFSIYAARRDDGALTLMSVNLADEEKSKTLEIAGREPQVSEAWLLDPTHSAEQVEASTILPGGQLTLPARSVVLLVIP